MHLVYIYMCVCLCVLGLHIISVNSTWLQSVFCLCDHQNKCLVWWSHKQETANHQAQLNLSTHPNIDIYALSLILSTLYIYIYIYIHHDNQVVLIVWNPWTFIFYLSLLFVTSGRSSRLHLDCIQCPHRANRCKSLLLGQHWCIHL